MQFEYSFHYNFTNAICGLNLWEQPSLFLPCSMAPSGLMGVLIFRNTSFYSQWRRMGFPFAAFPSTRVRLVIALGKKISELIPYWALWGSNLVLSVCLSSSQTEIFYIEDNLRKRGKKRRSLYSKVVAHCTCTNQSVHTGFVKVYFSRNTRMKLLYSYQKTGHTPNIHSPCNRWSIPRISHLSDNYSLFSPKIPHISFWFFFLLTVPFILVFPAKSSPLPSSPDVPWQQLRCPYVK